MARGKAKSTLLGIQGVVGHKDAPDWSFIYEASLIRDPKWNIGDHVKLPDGREFIYSKSSGVCASGQAAEFQATGFQSYSTPAAAAAIGDKTVVVTAGTHVILAADDLRGGYFVSWPAALKDQFRGIIGNKAAAANAEFTIYLDGPLTQALVAVTTGLEVYENPYANLLNIGTGGSPELAKAGVPATYVGAANTYFWVQVAGMGWVAPQSDVTGRMVGAYYRHDGSLQGTDTALGATVPAGNSSQYAGHRVIGSYAGNGPLFMLK